MGDKVHCYQIDPVTHLPREMEYDAGKLSPTVVCPFDGMRLQRFGTSDFYNCRCVQCGRVFGLAGPSC